MEQWQTGVDLIEAGLHQDLLQSFARIGLVTNQAATSSRGRRACDVVHAACKKVASGARLVSVFGPQHGYGQTEQDNMLETPDTSIDVFDDDDQVTSLPLYSLYSKTRRPTEQQMAAIDTLMIDLPDIGCRIYTYMATLAECLQAANEYNKRVVVLDRPNPLGLCWKDQANIWHNVEGNVHDLRWKSFVGYFGIPFRYGLTLGELGHFYLEQHGDLKCVQYSVIKVQGLRRPHIESSDEEYLRQSMSIGFPFASPNMPSRASALLFPSFVVLEATNISEGRGTTRPFQVVGAPYIDSTKCTQYLRKVQRKNQSKHNMISQIAINPFEFRPTFNKHRGELCKGVGFQLHANSDTTVNLFALGMYFLYYVIKHHANEFAWRDTALGYEYNFEDPPLLLILGNERWWKLFEGIRARSINEETAEQELEACLEWAHAEGSAWADKSAHLFLY